jgi:hypothetical protein
MSDVQTTHTQTNAVDGDGQPVLRAPGLSAAFDALQSGKEIPQPTFEPAEPSVTESVEPEPSVTEPAADPTPAEPSVTEPIEPEPSVAAPAAEDPDVLTDDDVKRMPRSQAKKIAKVRERLKELETTLDSERSTRQQKEQALAEYEAKVKQLEEQQRQFDPEAFKRTEEELLQYRRLHALESDPRIAQTFDQPLTLAEESITGILKRHGLQDSNLELIKSTGGFRAFAQKYPDIANDIFDKLSQASRVDAAEIQGHIAEQLRLTRDKSRFIEAEKATARTWFEEQQKLAEAQRQQFEGALRQNTEETQRWVQTIQDKVDFLKQDPIPATATPEEKKRLQELNGTRAQLRQVLNEALTVDTPEARRNIALLATGATWHKRRADELEAQLKAAREEVAKIKRAGRTVPQAGGGTPSAPRAPEEARPQSLTEALNLVAQGKDPLNPE